MKSRQRKAAILIVDDNVGLCRSTALVLGHKGYAVATAGDGPEAIEKVKDRPFDIIFLDVKMPVLDGVETYRRIKEIRPDAVVMMMTAYAVEDLVQDALREGAYGIVYKPLDIKRMIALIEEVKQEKQGALILVVDDDRETAVILKNILVKKGYDVGVARTGEEAISRARKQAYDILFIDMKLPTINGLETYLALRDIQPEAVAIMMTGHRQAMADLVEEALNNHAYTCVYKPLDMEELLELVEEIWRRKSGGAG